MEHHLSLLEIYTHKILTKHMASSRHFSVMEGQQSLISYLRNTILLLFSIFLNHDTHLLVPCHWLTCVVTLSNSQMFCKILWLIISSSIFARLIKQKEQLKKLSLWSLIFRNSLFFVYSLDYVTDSHFGSNVFSFCINFFHMQNK